MRPAARTMTPAGWKKACYRNLGSPFQEFNILGLYSGYIGFIQGLYRVYIGFI